MHALSVDGPGLDTLALFTWPLAGAEVAVAAPPRENSFRVDAELIFNLVLLTFDAFIDVLGERQ